MKKPARLVVVAALAGAVLSTTACTSVFPVGTFNWGHGAVPMKDGGVRVQAGGGGGAGLYGTFLPIAGGGGGAALEYQVNQALLLRVDGGAAVQTPGTTLIGATGPSPYTTLIAGYAGSQLTMSKDKTLALRLRAGGGVEDSPASSATGLLNTGLDLHVPYVGGEAKIVKSFVIDENLELWLDGGFGAKVPLFVPVASGDALVNTVLTVVDFDADVGAAWRVGDAGHVYVAGQAGVVVLLAPTPVASVQVGYTHTF